MARPRHKRTARDIAESISCDLLGVIRAKLDRFEAGDETAALTTDEVEFVQRCQALDVQSTAAETEAEYLRGLSGPELGEYHRLLRKSLESKN